MQDLPSTDSTQELLHAECTAPTRQHEVDHTGIDQECIFPEESRSSGNRLSARGVNFFEHRKKCEVRYKVCKRQTFTNKHVSDRKKSRKVRGQVPQTDFEWILTFDTVLRESTRYCFAPRSNMASKIKRK